MRDSSTRSVPRLADAFSSPEAKRRYNRRMFHTIAGRYDLITVILSYGLDRRWKRRLVDLAAIAPGERAVDLACGTCDLAFLMADRGAEVTGVDLTQRMLELARARRAGRAVRLVGGDMTAVPLAACCADVATAGYGLRNVPSLDASLAEVRRILRPGGRFLALDFNRPANRFARAAYLGYLYAVGSVVGFVLHRDPDTYRYISASLARYPGAEHVAASMEAAGFVDVRWIPVLGGLMAIHVGRRPALPMSPATASPRGC